MSSTLDNLRKMLKLDPGNQDIIDKINKERDKKSGSSKIWSGTRNNKASGGVIRLKSGGPVVDSYDYG